MCDFDSLPLSRRYNAGLAAFGVCVSLMGGLAIATDASSGKLFGILLVTVNCLTVASVIGCSAMETVSDLGCDEMSLFSLLQEAFAKYGAAARNFVLPR